MANLLYNNPNKIFYYIKDSPHTGSDQFYRLKKLFIWMTIREDDVEKTDLTLIRYKCLIGKEPINASMSKCIFSSDAIHDQYNWSSNTSFEEMIKELFITVSLTDEYDRFVELKNI